MTSSTSSGTYRQAAHNLDKHGWIRGAIGSPNEGFCLVGTLMNASGSRSLPLEMLQEVHQGLVDTSEKYRFYCYGVNKQSGQKGRMRKILRDRSSLQDHLIHFNDRVVGEGGKTVLTTAFQTVAQKMEWRQYEDVNLMTWTPQPAVEIVLDQSSQDVLTIARLRAEVQTLKARIEILETENKHLIKRMFQSMGAQTTVDELTAGLNDLNTEFEAMLASQPQLALGTGS